MSRIPLFKYCTTLRSLAQLHGCIMTAGLHRDDLVSAKLIESYAELGSVQSSQRVFDTFQDPDSFLWGMMINSLVWRNSQFGKAICQYHRMLELGVDEEKYIFIPVLFACAALSDVRLGKMIHARILVSKYKFKSDPLVQRSLMIMYGEMHCLYSALNVFNNMLDKDAVSWGSLIRYYVRNGQEREGLIMFRKIVIDGLEVDSVTMLSVVEACGELGLWRDGMSCHGCIIKRNLGSDHVELWSSLVAMYGKLGDFCSADDLVSSNQIAVSSWTVLISCYNRNGHHVEAIRTFNDRILKCRVEIDSVILMYVVCSCARLGWQRYGRSVHGYVIRNSIDLDRDFLRSSLIDMYANCGFISSAIRIFHDTQHKSVVTLNSMMCGLSKNGYPKEALRLVYEMYAKCHVMDEVTFFIAIQACSNLGCTKMGKLIHNKLITFGVRKDMYVDTALIAMYAQCGDLELAQRVFKNMDERSIVSRSSQRTDFLKALMVTFYHGCPVIKSL